MSSLKNTFLILLISILAACASRKNIVYFNDIERMRAIDTLNYLSPIIIQPGDILQITVSTINRDVTALFNPLSNSGNAPGYLVDSEGNIELPLIGKVYVKGKTTEAINTDLKIALEKSIKNAFVATRLLNFRISVLGDVARPGYYSTSNERLTILEALSMAGDVNLTARRNDVLLIREKEGKKQYVSIDLNNSKALSSPYYYLANNDVIYVKPGTNRVIASSTGFQLIPTIFGAISLILVIYTTARR